jgi:hypothetical protein
MMGAAYGSCGERCMAVPLIVAVGDATAEAMIAGLKAEIAKMKVGPGTDASNDMGPLVSKPHFENVKGYVSQGVAEGATLLVDGRGVKVPGHEDGYLLVLMCLGVLLANFMALGVAVQVGSAILLGLGYGLVYSVIQTQVINDAPLELRHAALTWFVMTYFVGIFGFPIVCGWLIVRMGTGWCLAVVLAIALAELMLAVLRRRA